MTERRVYLDEAMPGDVVARPVTNRAHLVLLDAGAVLTMEMIAGLKDHRVLTIDIRDDEPAPDEPPPPDWKALVGIEPAPAPSRTDERRDESVETKVAGRPRLARPAQPPPAVAFDPSAARPARREARALRARAVHVAVEAYGEIARRGDPRVRAIKDFVADLVRRGLENPHVFPSIVAVHAYDDALVDQAVRSTVYSVMIGWAMGMDRDELEAIAECAFLHDVGMTRVRPEVWRKRGSLALAERLEIQKHVIHGADILEEIVGISPWAEVVAYQHHERHDGTGYPKERRGVGIFEYARIVGLADYYAARTSPRPHRDRQHGYDVMRDVIAEIDHLFHPQVVRAFLSVMGLYPVGSRVVLSDGSTGQVVAANAAAPYRPVVRVVDLPDERGRPGEIIDLLRAPAVAITGPAA
jgi:HD-GYP domain-containing protein (c-di-GMP phosphodiesterase class II)